MSRFVLDSSAVLALILEEAGGDVVYAALAGSLMSTVNSSEVLLKLIDKGLSREQALTQFSHLNIANHDFGLEHAITAATLRISTKDAGLSFGDRACLALALTEGLPVLTGDRDWLRVSVGVDVRLIR